MTLTPWPAFSHVLEAQRAKELAAQWQGHAHLIIYHLLRPDIEAAALPAERTNQV